MSDLKKDFAVLQNASMLQKAALAEKVIKKLIDEVLIQKEQILEMGNLVITQQTVIDNVLNTKKKSRN